MVIYYVVIEITVVIVILCVSDGRTNKPPTTIDNATNSTKKTVNKTRTH